MASINDRLWVILGGLGGFATIILFIISLLPEEHVEKSLSVTALSVTKPFRGALIKDGSIQYISVGNQKVENFAVLEYRIRNTGNVTIRSADFEGTLKLSLPFVSNIYYHAIELTNRRGLNPIITTNSDTITIDPVLLNAGDGFIIQVGVRMVFDGWIDYIGLYAADVEHNIADIMTVSSNSNIDPDFGLSSGSGLLLKVLIAVSVIYLIGLTIAAIASRYFTLRFEWRHNP
ncbi:MAG: hypothetical protein ACFCUR_20820 [Rhodomicrobiaceae bacterium]